MESLFRDPYMFQLYETMKHLSLDEIRSLCRSTNKTVYNFCKSSDLVKQLLRDKETDEYIEFHGGNINKAFTEAISINKLTVVEVLLERGVN